MGIKVWSDLIGSLYDHSKDDAHLLPGVNLYEWLELIRSDYDSVDRMLIDGETIGGG